MPLRVPALVAAVGIVAALNGCDDPTSSRFIVPNRDALLSVYALNGTPPTFPAAITLRTPQARPVDANFAFDLAFDLTPSGVVVHTAGSVAGELASPRRVGLQTTSLTFAEATSAPTSGYVYDSLLVVGVGQTVFVDVFEPQCTSPFLGSNIRAKMVVDSFNVSSRAIYLHVLSNPNCGFKSLVVGEPKD